MTPVNRPEADGQTECTDRTHAHPLWFYTQQNTAAWLDSSLCKIYV